jgi:hypothetical protein
MQISKLVVKLSVVMVAGLLSTGASAKSVKSSGASAPKSSVGMNTATFDCANQAALNNNEPTLRRDTNPPQVAQAKQAEVGTSNAKGVN